MDTAVADPISGSVPDYAVARLIRGAPWGVLSTTLTETPHALVSPWTKTPVTHEKKEGLRMLKQSAIPAPQISGFITLLVSSATASLRDSPSLHRNLIRLK